MSKRFSVTLAASLVTVLLAGPAYPQKPETAIQLLQGDVIGLQSRVDELQRKMDTRTNTLQTLLERVVDKVNLMGGEIQTGVQTAVQNGVQNNAQTNQANADKLTRIVEELKAQNDRNDKAVAAAIAALNADIERLHASLLDKLTEKVTERTDKLGAQIAKSSADQLTQLSEKIDKLNGNVGDKMTQNFNGFQLQINALSDQLAKLAAQPKTVALPSPEQLLREAYSDCSLAAYSLCLDELNELLAKFPEHSVAPRAALLRADYYYNQGKLDEAAVYYHEIFEKYRDVNIKRTALLKRGLAEEKQKQTAAAIETARKVLEMFQGPSAEAFAAEEMLKRLVPPPPPPPPAPAPVPSRGGAAATPPRG